MQNEGVASQIREFVLMFSISKLEKWLGVNLQNSLKFNYHFCFLKKRPCQTLSKLITIFRIKKVTTDVQTHEWWEQKKCQKPVLLKSRKTKPLKSNLLEKFDDPFWHKFRQDIRLEHAWLSNYSPKESSCFFWPLCNSNWTATYLYYWKFSDIQVQVFAVQFWQA